MSTVVSSAALSSEAAAALMDIDGADLEDGFASIDQDASDEPTKILMIVGFQEQLNPRDIGLALHAHFDSHIRADKAASPAWLTRVLTLHTLPETEGGPITNTGKAFAICSDVATAKRVLEEFEEQYLEADVDEGFRLKLPAEVTQRLVQEGTLPAHDANSTDQLLICYAATTVLQQCRTGDTRDSNSTFAVDLEWGEARFSYSDPAQGVQCWNAAQELSQQAASKSSATGEDKKRSRSALIREALKSGTAPPAEQQQPAPPLDTAVLASVVQRAKIEFIKEQLSYGVSIVVPADLQAPLAAQGIRMGSTGQTPQVKAAAPLPLSAMHTLPVKPGTRVFPPPPPPPILPAPAPLGASVSAASAVSASATAAPPASRFLPARPSTQTIHAAIKPKPKLSTSGSVATEASLAPISGNGLGDTVPSPTVSDERKRSLSEVASTDAVKEKVVGVAGDVSPKVDTPVKSRWDIKERTPKEPAKDAVTETTTDKVVPTEPPLKKAKTVEAEAMLVDVPAPSTVAAPKESKGAKVEAAPIRSSRRIASGRSSIPAPAQAPPSFVTASARDDDPAARGATGVDEPLAPLEIPSGMRLPPPMEGFTRKLGQRDEEIPRNFDFCNPDRMLCLLCLRQFKSLLTLKKHVAESKLHQNNLDSPAARRAGASQLIQTYRPPRTPSSATPAPAPSTTSAPELAGSSAAAAVISPVTSTYRDRELERRAVRGPAPSGP